MVFHIEKCCVAGVKNYDVMDDVVDVPRSIWKHAKNLEELNIRTHRRCI